MKTVHGADFYANKRHKGEDADGTSPGGGGRVASARVKTGTSTKAEVSFAEMGELDGIVHHI